MQSMDFGSGKKKDTVQEQEQQDKQIVYVQMPAEKKSSFVTGFAKAVGVVLGIMVGLMIFALLITMGTRSVSDRKVQKNNMYENEQVADISDSENRIEYDAEILDENIKLDNLVFLKEDDGVSLTGDLSNVGDKPAKASIRCIAYDSRGNEVGFLSQSHMDKEIPSGETWSFVATPEEQFDFKNVKGVEGITVLWGRYMYFNGSKYYLLEPQSSSIQVGKTDSYTVSIQSARVDVTNKSEPLLYIAYEFTNTNDESGISFINSVHDKVFQGGVECESDIISSDTTNISKSILPGATIEVYKAYRINDLQSGIDVRVSESLTSDNLICSEKFEF